MCNPERQNRHDWGIAAFVARCAPPSNPHGSDSHLALQSFLMFRVSNTRRSRRPIPRNSPNGTSIIWASISITLTQATISSKRPTARCSKLSRPSVRSPAANHGQQQGRRHPSPRHRDRRFRRRMDILKQQRRHFLRRALRNLGNRLVFFNDADGNLLHLIQRQKPLP